MAPKLKRPTKAVKKAQKAANGNGAEAAQERAAQVQVYVSQDLLAWLDQDRAVCESEIQAEMGQQQSLSRSAHVVLILHQYCLVKSANDLGDARAGFREFWARIREAVEKQAAGGKKGAK
jgi:hypothetical protein